MNYWKAAFLLTFAILLIFAYILQFQSTSMWTCDERTRTNLQQLKHSPIPQQPSLSERNPKQSYKPKPPILEPLASRVLGPPGNATAEDELERIWNYVYNRQYHCTQNVYLGGQVKFGGDGAYSLCTEEQFWPFPNRHNKCLMYSFGIGKDFSFDDAMAERGCEVHSFDPSISVKDGTVRDSGVVFHKTGISDKDNNHGFKGWKMRTLSTIIKELGHQNRYLDYLKVDTDRGDKRTGFEDMMMQQLLDRGLYKCIRQYSMEIHMPGPLASEGNLKLCRNLYRLMTKLNDGGWRLYNTTDNVRYEQKRDPNFIQRMKKQLLLQGSGAPMLWEPAFVNFDVEGPCFT